MTHRNAPLTVEGRRRLIERCQSRPIAHVAAEMGISRQCASTWVNRYRKYGDLGIQDQCVGGSERCAFTLGWCAWKWANPVGRGGAVGSIVHGHFQPL